MLGLYFCTFTLHQTFSSWVIKATILHFIRDEAHAFGCGVFAVLLHSLTLPCRTVTVDSNGSFHLNYPKGKSQENSEFLSRFECNGKSVRKDDRIKQSENHTSDKFSSIKPALKFPGIRECVCVCVVRVCRGYEIKIICLCYSYCGAKKVQWSSVEASKKWRIFIALLFSFIWSTSTRLKSHTTWIISSFLFSVCISFRDLHALNSSFKSHPSRNVCVCVCTEPYISYVVLFDMHKNST